MARPLSPNSVPARNGGPSSLAGLAAKLARTPAPDDEPASAPAAWDDETDPTTDGPLSRENTALRVQLAETERLLAELRQEAEEAMQQQQTEFERILEEKSELIRDLHRKAQELKDRPAVTANIPREDELMALSEELERERQQLKDDEASLMEQMGHMEVQMSRERAELARQRNELQRLQHEIRHELDLASRDSALRDRLAPLQRRHQEMDTRRTTTSGPAAPPAPPEAPPDPPRPASTGLFRRIFG